LKKIIDEKWLTANGVIGIWEAEAVADDSVVISTPEEKVRLEFLRQQMKKASGQPNLSLADFIKPGGGDYMGAFAVSIHGIEPYLEQFIKDSDDYNKIILQAIADRLAEGFAEMMHARVRREFWGYAKDETLRNDELIKEMYAGIRPAPGYPACPDHTEKRKLFKLLRATEKAGIILTDALAMYPASSVCGWYIAHPESKYFGVGKISKDQVEDFANRKNIQVGEVEKWLRPQLGYDI